MEQRALKVFIFWLAAMVVMACVCVGLGLLLL